MKICIECGRQLFDSDESCDRCNSKNIISEQEYKSIINDLNSSNIFRKKKLLKIHNYKCIYDRLQNTEKTYPVPIILRNNKPEFNENSEEYWNRVNQHTLNENKPCKSVVECPYCHSKDTKKITIASKAVHTAVFGIYALGKVSKQWHCNHCDSDF